MRINLEPRRVRPPRRAVQPVRAARLRCCAEEHTQRCDLQRPVPRFTKTERLFRLNFELLGVCVSSEDAPWTQGTHRVYRMGCMCGERRRALAVAPHSLHKGC